MPEASPRKPFYKIGEVCQITDTQPYVLRFWESEFPQLAPTKSRSGQRMYRRRDIDLVIEIKKLLYQEGYTIAGARKKLGMTDSEGVLETLFDHVTVAPDDAPAAAPEAAPAAGPHPVRRAAPLPSIAAALEEILRVMDATDRRIGSRNGAGGE